MSINHEHGGDREECLKATPHDNIFLKVHPLTFEKYGKSSSFKTILCTFHKSEKNICQNYKLLLKLYRYQLSVLFDWV
jgi:hypothetical protein